MTDLLEFTVIGRPQPAGSKRGFVVKGHPVITDDNRKAKPWMAEIKAAAHEAFGDRELLTGPLILDVDFYVARPAGHYGTGRNHDRLKASAPLYPVVRPDATKLLRALEDALTGLVWRDDAQVVTQTARKRYGIPERAEILIDTAAPSLDELDDWRAQASDLEGLFLP